MSEGEQLISSYYFTCS